MSLSISSPVRVSSERRAPLPSDGRRTAGQHNPSLSKAVLPGVDVLEFFPCPGTLWSEDRTQCIVNGAMASIINCAKIAMDKDLWLSRLDSSDRERLLSSWKKLEVSDERTMCRYRFLPFGGKCAIELEETARRLVLGDEKSTAFLSRYRVIGCRPGPREPSPIRTLVHKIGNSLQAVRGEVDLLRLVGDLPQKTFDSITQGVESIHSLVAQIEDLADHDRGRTQGDGQGAPDASSEKPVDGEA